MPRIEMVNPSENPTVIKVVGVGGGGGNAINRMVDEGIRNVEFISINSDKQALSVSKADVKLVIGETITGGLGAGTDPSRGERAALEDAEKIEEVLKGADLVFIATGLGGGTGTGASPVIAQIAQKIGALTIGVVTKPFTHEGTLRMNRADEGIDKLIETVDSLVIIPNDNLYKIIDERMPYEEALRVADDVLRQGVQGISDIITIPGAIVNVDFADVRTMMGVSKGRAHMGIGTGKGDDRAQRAIQNALHNPLLELKSIKGAKGLLINIVGPQDFSLFEYQEVSKIINSFAEADANIKVGTCMDESLKDEIKITVIATGFENPVFDEEDTDALEESSEIDDLNELERKVEAAEETVAKLTQSTRERSTQQPPADDMTAYRHAQIKPDTKEEYEPLAPVVNDSKTENETPHTREDIRHTNERIAYKDAEPEQDTNKKYQLPFDVISDEEMKLHEKRGSFENLPSLNDEDELETPAFLRNRKKLQFG